MERFKIICTTADKRLAGAVAATLGVSLCSVDVSTFKNSEKYVRVNESIRGYDVFIIHPIVGNVDEGVMELLLLLDALKRSSAGNITVILPYYPYGRQEKQVKTREPIAARLIANLLEVSGAERVVSFDLHAEAIAGFFNIPTDNLSAEGIFARYYKAKKLSDVVVISPDVGGVKRARNFAKMLGAPLAIIDKRREAHNVAQVMNVIGDVKGKNAIIVDDMIDTAGTVVEASKALVEKGVKSLSVCATHAILSDPAVERIKNAPLQELLVSDTIPLPAEKSIQKIVVLSVADLLAEVIKRIHHHEPLSKLFEE